MTPYDESPSLEQELDSRLDILHHFDEAIEQQKSIKWLGRLSVAVGSVFSLPLAEHVVVGAHEAIPPSAYGGVAMVGLGLVRAKIAKKRQYKLENPAHNNAKLTDELVRFMGVVGDAPAPGPVELNRWDKGMLDKYLPRISE